MKKSIAAWCATVGPIGYLAAPGTVATMVTVPFAYWLNIHLANQWHYLMAVGILIVLSLFIIRNALQDFHTYHDPSEIVLDEVVGCMLVFWGVTMCTSQVVVGLILFRLLDIVKLGWIKRAEDFPGACGIVADDLLAALVTNGMLRLVF